MCLGAISADSRIFCSNNCTYSKYKLFGGGATFQILEEDPKSLIRKDIGLEGQEQPRNDQCIDPAAVWPQEKQLHSTVLARVRQDVKSRDVNRVVVRSCNCSFALLDR